MKQSGTDDPLPDESLAEELVDEALRGMAIPASILPTIRATMIGELLTTPEGRMQLRRAGADPKVSSSGDIAKPGAPRVQSAVGDGSVGTVKRKPRGSGRS